MGKIKTLREDVYKKIAAGEVVERPLSVVKELVENAIDAGADEIKIELADGGKQLIRITDNGSGFDPDDIETAFMNHSTSKISELSDFNTLHTLGFRGEALPSILEVSKIEIRTSNNNEGKGVRVGFENAKKEVEEEIACSRGTTISVSDLFYNFPVRKKFLKSDRTELTQIVSFLEPVTLVHFDKSFELIHNNKTSFLYKKTNSMKERVYQVFGKEFLDTLHELKYTEGNYRISGLISRLNTGIADKKNQFFFVNSRPVKEKTLVAALNNTFQRFLEKSRSPVAIIMLEIPPDEVDVNIHPMKLEIKFENSSNIYKVIKHAIENSFGMKDDLEDDIPIFGPGKERYSSGYSSSGGFGPAKDSGSRFTSYSGSSGFSNENREPRSFDRGDSSSFQGPPPRMAEEDIPPTLPTNGMNQREIFPPTFMGEEEFTIIGQYRNSYILIEKKGDLLLIDQHNAHERANFDDLKKEYQASNIRSISPLFPVMIEFSPSERALLDQSKFDILEHIGFRLEHRGGNSYDIKSFPLILGEKNIKEALLSIIRMDIHVDEVNFEDSILADIACKSAIKINHKLYPDQMKTIVKNLFKSSNPYFCPHKRPIIIEFTNEQIEKLLKRK